MGFAQSTLPATSPTAAPATSLVAAPSTSPAVPARAIHPAQVRYSPGLLEVIADDSSLTQILSEISRQTGMKLSGGVADERVFGKYGPAAPAEVIASLLDGTNTNMLLRETAASAPEELILTPREGGPTPPDVNGASSNNGGPSNPRAFSPASGQSNGEDPTTGPMVPRPPYAAAGGAVGGSPGYSPSIPFVRPTAVGPGLGATPGENPQSSIGQTPQQIYEQLQQMRPPPQ